MPLLLTVAACNDDRPPAPTAEEAEQLDEVENLLNEEAAKEKGRSKAPALQLSKRTKLR